MYWAIFVVAVIMSVYGYAEVKTLELLMDDPCETCREYVERSNNNCLISCFPPIDYNVKNEQKPLLIINYTEIKDKDNFTNRIIENKCCYSSECPQAINNPEKCECVYAVGCITIEK